MRIRTLLPIPLLFVSGLLWGGPEDVTIDQIFPGSAFLSSVGVRHAGDGSERLFAIERPGRISIIDGDEVLATPFLDIQSQVGTTFEQGLLGLAFHPDYAANGRFYVKYSASNISGIPNGDTVVSEFQVSGDNPDQADPASERIIIVIPQDSANHNGGDLHFGADGYLYIGMGDGGGGNDPCNRGQTLDPSTTPPGGCATGEAGWLLGKMVRIDIDSTTPAGSNNLCAAEQDGSAEYAVPADNPFAAEPDVCGEVWAYGLRNPYRFSFDRETGDLWIGDVGQNTWEEVNFEPAGDSGGNNYGWSVCEGSYQRGSTTQPCSLADSVLPVMEYPISGQAECAITGGYRYRGPITSLQGAYVFADFCSQNVWVGTEDGSGDWSFELLDSLSGGSGLVGFGEDEAGNLYATQLDGTTYRFNGDVAQDAPSIQSIDPSAGPAAGGTEVTIAGENFVDGAEVTIGTEDCLSVTVVDDSTITCEIPAGDPGTVDVTVTNPDDQSDTLAGGFTYLPDDVFQDRFEEAPAD